MLIKTQLLWSVFKISANLFEYANYFIKYVRYKNAPSRIGFYGKYYPRNNWEKFGIDDYQIVIGLAQSISFRCIVLLVIFVRLFVDIFFALSLIRQMLHMLLQLLQNSFFFCYISLVSFPISFDSYVNLFCVSEKKNPLISTFENSVMF